MTHTSAPEPRSRPARALHTQAPLRARARRPRVAGVGLVLASCGVLSVASTAYATHAPGSPADDTSAALDTQAQHAAVAADQLDQDPAPSADPAPIARRDAPSRLTSRYVLMGVDCFGDATAEDSLCLRVTDAADLTLGQALPFGWTGNKLADTLRRSNKLAYISISPTFYPDGTAYITLDVVPMGARDRLNLPAPDRRAVTDDPPLLGLYAEYSNHWLGLLRRGHAPAPRLDDGFWDYDEASLQAYAALFRAKVPALRDTLIAIATEERDATYRRAAAGLLGFDTDDRRAAQALGPLLLDPNSNVRNEAARSLLPKLRRASSTGEPLIDPAFALRMLDLPSPADRTNAARLLAELARIPELRRDILNAAFPTLSQMLTASRPNTSDYALDVLQAATGLDHGKDVERWRVAIHSDLAAITP